MHCSRSKSDSHLSQSPSTTAQVTLHVYNVGNHTGSVVNRFLKPFGTGAFHCGVEVYGWEWSYSDIAHPSYQAGTGIFSCRPRNCEGHSYCESVKLGRTATSEPEVLRLITLLEKDWLVCKYDLLNFNCCHFSDELCQRLRVGGIPTWIMSLAATGASVASTGELADTTCCRIVAFEAFDSVCTRDSSSASEKYVESIPAIPQGSKEYSKQVEPKRP